MENKYSRLTETQKKVADEIYEYLTDPLKDELDFVVLKGYAGTGKSFLLSAVVERYTRQMGMTAPTHKAVQVLRKRSENPRKYTFGTIHSLLGLSQDITDKGEVRYVPSKDNEARMNEVDALIVDEVSMLDPMLFELLMRYKADRPSFCTIFTGDPLQIPPVGKTLSCVFDEDFLIEQGYKFKTFELTEPMRQASDSPILTYATDVRQSIGRSLPLEGYEAEDLVVLGKDSPEFHALIPELFGEEFSQDSDFAKFVAWTNRETDYLNTLIRVQRFNHPQPAQILQNERLVADKPIFQQVNRKWTTIIHTSEEMLVTKVQPLVYKAGFMVYKTLPELVKIALSRDGIENPTSEDMARKHLEFKTNGIPPTISLASQVNVDMRIFYCTVVLDRFGKQAVYNINILDNQDLLKYNDILRKLKLVASHAYSRKQAWIAYYDFQKHFANVKYNYALTAHKSQGSSYENVVVQLKDIRNNSNREERSKIEYVAVTRAKKKLYVII